MSEASEGFAKLAGASLAAALSPTSPRPRPGLSLSASPGLLDRIHLLTGSFRLDPARALDLVLAAIEATCRPETEAAAASAAASVDVRAAGAAALGVGW